MIRRLAFVPLLVGCAQAPDLQTHAKAWAKGNDQCLVMMTITRGDALLSMPSVLCNAGESASVAMEDEESSLLVDIQAPQAGSGDLVEILVTWNRHGEMPRTDRLNVPLNASDAPDAPFDRPN